MSASVGHVVGTVVHVFPHYGNIQEDDSFFFLGVVAETADQSRDVCCYVRTYWCLHLQFSALTVLFFKKVSIKCDSLLLSALGAVDIPAESETILDHDIASQLRLSGDTCGPQDWWIKNGF